ncbi:MAG: hypothetical protein J0H49_07010 [Acidobacteria bacterium]|nr:hypothetical protein [Acidobacteriota bacterium]
MSSPRIANVSSSFLAAITFLIFCLVPLSAQEYLPLALGNRWVLTNSYQANPMSLEVVSDEVLAAKRRVRVRFTNPWTNYDFVFNPGTDGISLEGLAIGSEVYFLSAPQLIFPKTGTAGTIWNTSFGSVTLVSTSTTVVTPGRTYTNCRRFSVNLYGGAMDWVLADGVGYVQIGTGPGAFTLGTMNLSSYTAPVAPSITYGPCPKIGIDSNPASSTSFSTAEREAALASVAGAGGNFSHVSVRWSDIEKSPGVYDFSSITQWMSWAAKYNFDVALTVRTIDTTVLSVPPDLAGRKLSDATVISRFVTMMKAMKSVVTTKVRWINLGNEVDVYLRNVPAASADLQTFLQAMQSQLKSQYPSATFGVVFTHAARSTPSVVTPILALSGHVGFTYYPLNADMSVRAPSVVASELAEIVALAGGKPLVLTEVGYPTSALLGGSESAQSTFVQNIFDALRTSSGKVQAANFFQLNDMPSTVVSSLVDYYNTSGFMTSETAQRVGAFIASLGLHSQTSTDKLSWKAFVLNAPLMAGSNACTTN